MGLELQMELRPWGGCLDLNTCPLEEHPLSHLSKPLFSPFKGRNEHMQLTFCSRKCLFMPVLEEMLPVLSCTVNECSTMWPSHGILKIICFIYVCIYFVWVCVCEHAHTCMSMPQRTHGSQRTTSEVSSLLLSCGSWRENLGPHAL